MSDGKPRPLFFMRPYPYFVRLVAVHAATQAPLPTTGSGATMRDLVVR